MNSRLINLRQEIARLELSGILISQPENRFYLSGFDGSDGYLFITGDRAVLATDFRYTEQAERQAPDYEIFRISGQVSAWLPGLVSGINSGKLGFEAENVSFNLHSRLTAALAEARNGLSLTPTDGVVGKLREMKEPDEIELISRAAELADTAYERVADRIQPGMTEKEIAWELERTMRESGSEGMPFEIIVASGPNAALPHHQPSMRRIQKNETIVIDMGARVGGYCSDMSRTLYMGTPDDTFRKVYNTVLDAQVAAINGISEGMSGHEADNLAREVIEQAGYGEAFGHSLGHGVGLVAHEEPRLSPNATGLLGENMVFSIEPGVYLSGWGGVRIEDLAVMENGKVKLLSKALKLDTMGGRSLT
ncbi:MAG TPA: aminopeptidase P family protein [Dehalococcoidia bacterium]|nr:aminopeptidase P family protein [Dehalococcoidia bacterium]